MKVIKGQKPNRSFLLRAAIFVFAAYTLVMLVNQQVEIQEKRRELSDMKQQIQIQEIKNEDLKHALSAGTGGNSDYIEREARKGLDYAKPGERVFINIAGN